MVFNSAYDGLTDKNPAKVPKETANTAIDDSDISIAHVLINAASRVGQHSISWTRPMTDSLRKHLEGNQYTIEDDKNCVVPGSIKIIRF